MKLKSILKFGLPIIGLASIATVLPLTLTSCGNNAEQNKQVNINENTVQSINNSLDKVLVNNKKQASQHDVRQAILSSLNISNKEISAINYIKDSEEVSLLDESTNSNTKTKWNVYVTLENGYKWNVDSNSSNSLKVEGQTLSFKVETKFSTIEIDDNNFSDQIIKDAINNVHNLKDKNSINVLKSEILKENKEFVFTSFDVKLSSNETSEQSKNDSLVKNSKVNVELSANTENGFVFKNKESNKKFTVDYKYVDLTNESFQNEFIKTVVQLVANNNQLINKPVSKQIQVKDFNTNIDVSLSTINPIQQATILKGNNGQGTYAYSFKFALNNTNIGDFSSSILTNLQNAFKNEILKLKDESIAKITTNLKPLNYFNLVYNAQDNSIDIQVRSKILNTTKNEIKNLVELVKQVEKDALTGENNAGILSQLRINYLPDFIKQQVNVNTSQENKITISVKDNISLFSKDLLDEFKTQKDIDGAKVQITNNQGNQILEISNLTYGTNNYENVASTKEDLNKLINDAFQWNKSDFNSENIQTNLNGNKGIVVPESPMWNEIINTLKLDKKQVSYIVIQKTTKVENQITVAVTLNNGYTFKKDGDNALINSNNKPITDFTADERNQDQKELIKNLKVTFGGGINGSYNQMVINAIRIK